MTSNRCFCDFALVRDNLRRHIWALVLSAVGFFFVLPLPVAMQGQQLLQRLGEINKNVGMADVQTAEELIESASGTAAGILGYDNFMVKAGMLIMAVVCGIMLFSYLHNRTRVDFYHALPISRTCLFGTRFVCGIVMVLPAYLVMQLLAVAIAYGFGMGGGVVWAHIARNIAVNVVFFLCIYAISVLCTVLCGNTIIAVLLDCWALGSASVLVFILGGYANMFYQTYVFGGWSTALMIRLSPVVQYFAVGSGSAKIGYVFDYAGSDLRIVPLLLIYLAVAAAAMLLACWLFRRRKSERSGTALAFEPVKLPIKIYIVLVLALAFGLFFYALGSTFWLWFGLIAGAALSHMIVEIIYHFDFRAGLCRWKTMIALAAAACAVVGLMHADVTGYDKWVPAPQSVQAVGIEYWSQHSGWITGMSGQHGNSNQAELTDRTNIENICAIAQQAVEGGIYEDYAGEDYASLTVQYRLNSGRVTSRTYYVHETADMHALFNQTRFSVEYQQTYNPLFSFDPQRFVDMEDRRGGLQIRTAAVPDGGSASAIITDEEQLAAVLDALRKETLTLTVEQATSEVPVLRIDLGWYGRGYSSTMMQYVPVYESFTKTLSLIEQFTGVVPTKLAPEQVREIVITKYVPDAQQEQEVFEGGQTYEPTVAQTGLETHRTSDPLEIAVLLENAVTDGAMCAADRGLVGYPDIYEERGYSFRAELTDGHVTQLYYRTDETPNDLLRQYFGD